MFISRVNLYYGCPVMNGLTPYQKSLIADARTGFWDWECPRCRRKTRGFVAVQSDFRCEDHTNAKLVLRDHLALMDQEHINRILFGGPHLLNA